MNPNDIWQSANLFLKAEGMNAALAAEQLSQTLSDEGDWARASHWFCVARAIEDLMRLHPEPGEAVN